MARPFFTDHMDFQHLTWNRPTWTAIYAENFHFLFFLIWLLNLLLNSGRLSDITGWCPKSLAKLVQMSLITRDYEIIFIVNPTNTTGGTTLHQLMVFQFFPLCVSIQFRWPHVHRRCGLMPPPWCLQICIGASRSGIQSSNFDVFVVGFIIPVAKKDGGLTTHLYIL